RGAGRRAGGAAGAGRPDRPRGGGRRRAGRAARVSVRSSQDGSSPRERHIMNLLASRHERRRGRERDAARRRLRLRPTVLTLEGRTLLSTTWTVTQFGPDDGSTGTLSWAVGKANADHGGDTIQFDSTVFSTPRTITLSGTQLELSGTTAPTTITGPAGGVTVSGNNASRVFQVDANVTASISGLTITGGKTSGNGGGLFNNGTTTLTNCTVSGNSATTDDGGLLNNGYTATLTNTIVAGNTSGGSPSDIRANEGSVSGSYN